MSKHVQECGQCIDVYMPTYNVSCNCLYQWYLPTGLMFMQLKWFQISISWTRKFLDTCQHQFAGNGCGYSSVTIYSSSQTYWYWEKHFSSHWMYDFRIHHKKGKWWFSCIYNPCNKHKVICTNSVENIINAANSEYVKISFIIGNLNIHLSCDQDRRALGDVLHVYDMENIVTSPTCFKSVGKPTLFDVILTTRSVARRISDVLNTNTGLTQWFSSSCGL